MWTVKSCRCSQSLSFFPCVAVCHVFYFVSVCVRWNVCICAAAVNSEQDRKWSIDLSAFLFSLIHSFNRQRSTDLSQFVEHCPDDSHSKALMYCSPSLQAQITSDEQGVWCLLLITTEASGVHDICCTPRLYFVSRHSAEMEDISISYRGQLEAFSEFIKSRLTFYSK